MESLGTEIRWPSKISQAKQSRIDNHRNNLHERVKEIHTRLLQKAQCLEAEFHGNPEITKAVAWAVFQHHCREGMSHFHPHFTVRQPSRFKIEALMQHAIAQESSSDALTTRWGGRSTLLDSFEVDSLMKALNQVMFLAKGNRTENVTGDWEDHAEGPGAMVVYSPEHQVSRPSVPQALPQRFTHGFHCRKLPVPRDSVEDIRLRSVDVMPQSPCAEGYIPPRNGNNLCKHHDADREDGLSSATFGPTSNPILVKEKGSRRHNSFKERFAREGAHSHHDHHHNKWKSFLHALHLDRPHGGLFHGSHKSLAQVVPFESSKRQERKDGDHKPYEESYHSHGGHSDVSSEEFDSHFERNDVHISKNVDAPHDEDVADHHHHHHPHFWKFGFKSVISHSFFRHKHLLNETMGHDLEVHPHRAHKHHHGHHHKHFWPSIKSILRHHHREDDHGHRNHSHRHDKKHDSILGYNQQGLEREHREYSHRHYHDHHAHSESEEDELTIKALARQSSRCKFEEKTQRLSIEECGSSKVPRNSLEDQGQTRVNTRKAAVLGSLGNGSYM